MDCESCQPNLLDLAYGELAPDAAEQSQAHLRECASCRSAFEKLQRGLRLARSLPRAAPPEEVGRQLLAMAEAKAAAVTTEARRQAAPERGFFRPLIELVSRFAMARQVGMVTITVLIAVVGLVALPQLRPTSPTVQESATSHARAVRPVTPAPEGKAGVQPADRLDLHVDPQARRVRTKDELARALPPSREVANAKSADDLRDVGMLADRAPAAKAEKKSAARMRAAAPEPFPASPSADVSESLQSAAASPAMQRASGAAEPPATTAADALAKQQPSPLAGGTSAEESASPAAPDPTQGRRAQLAAARAIEARGNCSAARSAYERVIAAGPDSEEAGAGLIALALCARQHGDDTTARTLLERASKIPTASARARALLNAPAKAKSARPAASP